MSEEFILEHRDLLKKRLEAVELERARLIRQLKAIDILLEGNGLRTESGSISAGIAPPEAGIERRRPHAVRTSPRSSLINAVWEVANMQSGSFDSRQLLVALQREYPEFNLTETKHISSPLSDLVEKGLLVLERKRIGSTPNLYRVQGPK